MLTINLLQFLHLFMGDLVAFDRIVLCPGTNYAGDIKAGQAKI